MSESFTPIEATRRLKVDWITIYRWIKSGRLQANRLPDGWLCIEGRELDKLLTKIKEQCHAE